jgi:hypothetical protein
MYQMQGETAKQVEALTGEVRALRDAVNPAFADVRHDLGDHETRLRAVESKLPDNLGVRLSALEQVRWKASGGIALVSSLVASGVVAAVLEATRK